MAINDYILEIPNLTGYVLAETAATEPVTEENQSEDEMILWKKSEEWNSLLSRYGIMARVLPKTESSISSTLCSAFNSDAVNDPGGTSQYTGDGFEVWLTEKLKETNRPWNTRGDRCVFWPVAPTSCTIQFVDGFDYECTGPIIINENVPYTIEEEKIKLIVIVLSRISEADFYGFTTVPWEELKTMSSNDTLVPPKS